MQSNFATIKICSHNESGHCDLSLEDISEKFAKSRNPQELEYYWSHWYNLAGKPVIENFKKYVDLKNLAAVMNSLYCKLMPK